MTTRQQIHRWLKILVWVLTGLVVLGILAGSTIIFFDYIQRPALSTIFKATGNPQSTDKRLLGIETQTGNTRYLDSEGRVFYQSNLAHIPTMSVSDTKASKTVLSALVATEDRSYFKEGGVNWLHTAKAGVETFFGHEVVGGSTITQQLIKLSFFSTARSDQTVKRKIQEIALARELNQQFSKYQILTWYLNKTSYSNGIQGLASAAKQYYHKSPTQLSTLEAATLVGVINSPQAFNIYVHPQATLARRNVVLSAMYTNNQLSKHQFEALRRQPLSTGLVSRSTNLRQFQEAQRDQMQYNGFVSGVNAQLSRYDSKLLAHSSVVRTTMNRSLQDSVTQAVSHQSYPDSKMEEAIAVVDNKNGNVVAMSGGRHNNVMNGFNRAYGMYRSSGSSIKPLLDYGPAFDLFNYNAQTVVQDTPYNYPGTNKSVNDWDRLHEGDISVKQALVQSRNIPAVRTFAKVGLTNGRKVLTALGLPNKSVYYSNAIGVNTNPLSMASAYSSLANYGKRANPRLITEIHNSSNGQSIKTGTMHEQVYTPQTAYLLTNILKGVFTSPKATGRQARVSGINEAGKTGTVSRNGTSEILTDGWMVGYTKSYTVAVWVGYENPQDPKYYLTNKTSLVSDDLYKSVMSAASRLPNANNSDWSAPSGVNEHSQTLTASASKLIKDRTNFASAGTIKYPYVPFSVNLLPEAYFDDSALIASYPSSLYESINRQYDGKQQP